MRRRHQVSDEVKRISPRKGYKENRVKVIQTLKSILRKAILCLIQVYEPTYRDTNNIIFIRDELESGASSLDSSQSGPILVRAMEELNPGQLRQSDITKDATSQNESKIFTVRIVLLIMLTFNQSFLIQVVDETLRGQSKDAKDDVQIMKLDEENRITETYQKIGEAEVLKIEDNPVAEELNQNQSLPILQDVATSPRYDTLYQFRIANTN